MLFVTMNLSRNQITSDLSTLLYAYGFNEGPLCSLRYDTMTIV